LTGSKAVIMNATHRTPEIVLSAVKRELPGAEIETSDHLLFAPIFYWPGSFGPTVEERSETGERPQTIENLQEDIGVNDEIGRRFLHCDPE